MKSTLAWAFGLALVTTPAFAQPPSSPTSSATDEAVAAREAKARFDEGLKRYAAHDYEGAWAAFTQAYSVLKSADVLWNLCMAELRSGRAVDAIRHIRAYLRDPRTTDADRARARKYLAEAHQKTAHVLLEVPVGSSVVVDGASVDAEIDAKEPIDVASGKHKVECKQGTASQSVELDLVVGQTVSVRFLPPSDGQAPATPTVTTVRAQHEAPGPDRAADGSGSSTKTILGLSLAGGALVAAGLGVGFLVASGSAGDDAARIRSTLSESTSGCYRSQTQACRELSDAVGDESTLKNVSTGAFVAAGALAVGSAAVLLLWPSRGGPSLTGRPATGRLTVSPTTAGGGVGAVFSGSF